MALAIVLLAHGSRDPQWSLPFERIAERLRARPQAAFVEIAYLEHGPALIEALKKIPVETAAVRLVPLFLGAGGHVKVDLPRLVDRARGEFPALDITLETPIGERAEVIAAIAAAISGPEAGR